ncbi:MAG TPA: CHRD domain-containing protein, partial [Chitinophagaceae bacterium]
MKQQRSVLKRIMNFSVLLMAAGIFSFTSCNDEDNPAADNSYELSGNASGAQVSPAVSSTATASLTGSYNSATNIMQYNVTWTGLAVAADSVALYGPADAGANGSFIGKLTITTPGVNGTASGSAQLTEDEEADLLANKWYYSIQNATYMNGEIRGQVLTTKD